MDLKKMVEVPGAMLGYQVSGAAVPSFGGLAPFLTHGYYMPLNSEFSTG